MSLGGWEILVIVAVVVLLFGANQIPKLAKSMGSFVSEFNKAKEEAEKTVEELSITKKTKKTEASKKKSKKK